MRTPFLLAAAALACIAAPPADAGSSNPNRTTSAAASLEARDAFFDRALDVAKGQLSGDTSSSSPAVPLVGGQIAAMGSDDPDPADPLPTADATTATCGESATCKYYGTCHGVYTCTNTCSGYPTCTGEPSMCASTCTTHPTCTADCKVTSGQWDTCRGNNQPTQTCNKSCDTYPTCYSTCNGSGPTCGSGQETCQSWTCSGAPSCTKGEHTCNYDGGCLPTHKSQSSCQGTPPSYCANTCSGYPTCVGFDCSGSDGSQQGSDGSTPLSLALVGLGTVLLRKRSAVQSS